jgi:hypothetical protein
MPAKRTKPGRPISVDWKTTRQACEALGISDDTLLGLRKKEGNFRKGYHWRVKNPTAARLTYLWHLPRLEQFFGEVLEA